VPLTRTAIAANVERIRQRMAAAAHRAGRPADSVRLVAVTKTVGPAQARVLQELGVTEFGENRVDHARTMIDQLGAGIRWHMIGSIQRRKAREVTVLFDCVDSIDRLELAEALEKRCADCGKRLAVLVEVNVSGEASKHGFPPDRLAEAVEKVGEMPHLELQGLMTMAPLVADPETVRPVFATLRRLADEFSLAELSMGMTNDFEIAIEAGATQIRVGSALFQ